jgi:HK97 family phage major capsid protein
MEFETQTHALDHAIDRSIETKAITDTDQRALYDEMMRTFDALKATNDEHLASLKRRGDTLIEEKLARIDSALSRKLDELTLKSARPRLGGEALAAKSQIELEHKAAFETYVRSGESHGLRAIEQKSMSIGSNPDGGYLVPPEVETFIGERLATISPIRSIASVRTVSTNVFKKPFMTSGPAVGWVGETAARTETGSPTLAELSFPAMELYAMPAATSALLEDNAVNLDQWLAGEIDQVFAVQEGAAFVTGDGVNKPTGFLTQTIVAESSWAWGKLGFVGTGVSGGFPSTGQIDPVIDLVYALKAGYRQNGSFVMNRRTQSAVRKLKDGEGNYLWQPPAGVGGRASLLNFPVVEAEDMPDIGASTYAIAFGDFARGYLIVDRAGVRVLRDPYTSKPYVLFYTTKRVGGNVQDFDAIKLLKFV